MSQVKVGKWGKTLAVRLPASIARRAGFSVGEPVEIEMRDGDVVIRRTASESRAAAESAAEEIIAEAGAYSLDDATIRALLEEGRRG